MQYVMLKMNFYFVFVLLASTWGFPVSNVYNLTENNISIAVISSPDELFHQHGSVFIHSTQEFCTGEEYVKKGDIDFKSLKGEFDISALPKIGKQKYCVSKLQKTRLVSKKDLKAPIAPCLDSSLGDGGSITKGISVSVSLSGTITPALADPILGLINFSSSFTTGLSVGISFSHVCTAAAGDTIQMWLTPIVGVTNFEYRTYHQWRGQKYSYSDYKTVSNFEFPVSGFQPAVECYKSKYVDCGALVKRDFILASPNI